jgi:hypothetical protein
VLGIVPDAIGGRERGVIKTILAGGARRIDPDAYARGSAKGIGHLGELHTRQCRSIGRQCLDALGQVAKDRQRGGTVTAASGRSPMSSSRRAATALPSTS